MKARQWAHLDIVFAHRPLDALRPVRRRRRQPVPPLELDQRLRTQMKAQRFNLEQPYDCLPDSIFFIQLITSRCTFTGQQAKSFGISDGRIARDYRLFLNFSQIDGK